MAFSNWWTIDTPDKYSVVLTSDSPRPLLWDYFEYLNIADSQVLDGPDSKTKVGGTGPFAFIEWAQGDHIHLVRNTNYWQSGKPYLDSIDYAIFKDAQTMVAQLEAGALDMALNPPLRDLGRLKDDATYQAISNPQSGRYYTVGWTTLTKPLDDKRVRQALNYALDRQRFVDSLLGGFGVAETLFWLPGSPAYDASRANYYAYDAAATETDPQKQKQIYSQLNDLLLDAAFNTALASASPHMLLRSNFQGIGYTLHEGFD